MTFLKKKLAASFLTTIKVLIFRFYMSKTVKEIALRGLKKWKA